MRLHALLVIAMMAAACGDDPPPPPPPAAPAAKATAAPKKAAPKKAGGKQAKVATLQPRMKIEDRVTCPPEPIQKATGPACKPDVPSCDPGLFCVPVGTGFNCEPCPERDTIRHEFKDRDFVADQVRDPFQSYVIVPAGLIDESDKKIEGPCRRADQFVATNYSYLDLRLVGIVARGAERKVLMMDRGNLGHIIRMRDCVGKEKAVVKDIGPGYVTFVIAPDPDDPSGKAPEEHSVQLHPKGLQVQTPDTAVEAPTAPIVAPPGGAPEPAPQAPQPPPAPAPTSP